MACDDPVAVEVVAHLRVLGVEKREAACLGRHVAISGCQHHGDTHADEPDDGGCHGRQEPAGDRAGEDAEREREHHVAEDDDAVDVEEDVAELLS